MKLNLIVVHQNDQVQVQQQEHQIKTFLNQLVRAVVIEQYQIKLVVPQIVPIGQIQIVHQRMTMKTYRIMIQIESINKSQRRKMYTMPKETH